MTGKRMAKAPGGGTGPSRRKTLRSRKRVYRVNLIREGPNLQGELVYVPFFLHSASRSEKCKSSQKDSGEGRKKRRFEKKASLERIAGGRALRVRASKRRRLPFMTPREREEEE